MNSLDRAVNGALTLRLTLTLTLTLTAGVREAGAHGGPPVSQDVMRKGDRLLVPTLYWGVFFGRDPQDGGGPWRWICEEAINPYQERRWTMAGSGAFHVTDYLGITSSRDAGCTWISATGEIAKRATSGVLADPASPTRAWAATSQATDVPWNALFVTDDDGLTWEPTLQVDQYLRGPAVSKDGQSIYVVGLSRDKGSKALTLHASRDGGRSWSGLPIAFDIDGVAQLAVEPLAVDPKDGATVYLAVRGELKQLLVKATRQGAKLEEQARVAATLTGMAFDPGRDAVLVSLAPLAFQPPPAGLMRSVGGKAFEPFSDLARAQCVVVDGDRLYACSSNFAPDSKALARSDDGGQHFSRIFQYDDTVGPTTDCDPSTPVAKICPGIWEMYWVKRPDPDLGGTMDAPDLAWSGAPMADGCSCRTAHRARPSSGFDLVLPLACVALVARTAGRARRRRSASSRTLPIS